MTREDQIIELHRLEQLIQSEGVHGDVEDENSTNMKQLLECVINNVNGFLVEIKNPINLAEKMYNLYLNKDLRMQMGKKSFDIVKKEFSIDKVVNETFKVYNSI